MNHSNHLNFKYFIKEFHICGESNEPNFNFGKLIEQAMKELEKHELCMIYLPVYQLEKLLVR